MIYELKSTETFERWLKTLDKSVKNPLLSRLARLENGNFGDHKQIGVNLFELRCTFGGGIRVYYTIVDKRVVLLIAGGSKSTQSQDIEKAQDILRKLGEGNE